jgi:hypothetical protein
MGASILEGPAVSVFRVEEVICQTAWVIEKISSWAIGKKHKQGFVSKPLILPFDVHTLHYFST